MDENMTLKEVERGLNDLEHGIAKLCAQFEDAYGVEVYTISINTKYDKDNNRVGYRCRVSPQLLRKGG